MASGEQETSSAQSDASSSKTSRKKRRRRLRRATLLTLLLAVIGALVIARLLLPSAVRWYVNRTINQSLVYEGRIGDVDIHLWRGAYSIEDIRIQKITGNTAAPLFSTRRLDLAVDWSALMSGEVVGEIAMDSPELNFIDSDDSSGDQTGAGGPWLEIIQDLFPFSINSATVNNGTIRFRAVDTDPPVDVYLSELNATVENLTNINEDITPLIATVEATAMAMDHAEVEYRMEFDPSSYRPTFQVALRLIGLDVTKINTLAKAYGQFDFQHGWFDLVVELDAKEGQVEGYVRPLFRNLRVFSVKEDLREGNPVEIFWEALAGGVSEALENQPRNQLGTQIELRGDLDNPDLSILEVVGNVLRNAFVRAYLPRLEGEAEQIESMEFRPTALGTEP